MNYSKKTRLRRIVEAAKLRIRVAAGQIAKYWREANATKSERKFRIWKEKRKVRATKNEAEGKSTDSQKSLDLLSEEQQPHAELELQTEIEVHRQ